MDVADQICELPQMLRDVGPASLSSNPCLRGTQLPSEDHTENTVTLRRGSGETNNSDIPVTLRRGSGEKNNSDIPVQLRRASGGRRGSADIPLYEGRRASWGYAGSHLLKYKPLERGKNKIENDKRDGSSLSIAENVENIDKTKNEGSSKSLAENIGNNVDTKKDESSQSISESIVTKVDKSTQTIGNSVIEKMKRNSMYW